VLGDVLSYAEIHFMRSKQGIEIKGKKCYEGNKRKKYKVCFAKI
jgi:hypothetical protein